MAEAIELPIGTVRSRLNRARAHLRERHSYEGFLVYHLMMGIALSMISGGDVALLYDSHLAAGGERSRGAAILGNMKLAGQTGVAVSALLGGAVVTLSYGHLLWTNAILSWIPMFLAPAAGHARNAAERGRRAPSVIDRCQGAADSRQAGRGNARAHSRVFAGW